MKEPAYMSCMIERKLRDEFVILCKKKKTTVRSVLPRIIEDWVKKQKIFNELKNS